MLSVIPQLTVKTIVSAASLSSEPATFGPVLANRRLASTPREVESSCMVSIAACHADIYSAGPTSCRRVRGEHSPAGFALRGAGTRSEADRRRLHR